MKRIVVVALALLCLGLASAFADTKPMKAGKDEVVFVFKLNLQPDLPLDFYGNYVEEGKRGRPETKVYAQIYAPDSMITFMPQEVAGLNEFAFLKVKAKRDRVFHLSTMQVRIFNSQTLTIFIPFNVQLKVREGVDYVYLGSFVYRYSDEYFTPESLERRDEFDAALESLKAGLGPDVKLSRATLTELGED